MGPAAARAAVGRALHRAARGRRVPDGLGAVEGGGGGAAGDPARRDAPDRLDRAVAARVRERPPRGRPRARDLLLEPLEPPRRDADHVHAARALAEEDRGRRGARLLLRRVVAPGVHRARVRGVPDRSGARRHDRDRQGARAGRRRLVDRRVPGGNALARRAHAAVPARGVAAGARARRRAGAGRDHRGVPGDAEGPMVAAEGPAGGDAPLRRGVVPRGGRDAPAPVRRGCSRP